MRAMTLKEMVAEAVEAKRYTKQGLANVVGCNVRTISRFIDTGKASVGIQNKLRAVVALVIHAALSGRAFSEDLNTGYIVGIAGQKP